jgi:hypothetical protein
MLRLAQDCGDQLLFSERFVCENREIRVPVEPLHNHIGLFCLSAHLICA